MKRNSIETLFMLKHSVLTCGSAAVLLCLSLGCSTFCSQERPSSQGPVRAHFCKKCETQAVPATVEVGGRVHSPKIIEIGDAGLTLRRSLALAGGARDSLVAAETTQRQITVDRRLTQLTSLSKEVGRNEFDLDLYVEFPGDRAEIQEAVGTASDTIKASLDEATEGARLTVEALIEVYGKERITDLEDWSKDAGRSREQLRLFKLPQSRSTDPTLTRETLERLADRADALVAQQLDNLRATQAVGISTAARQVTYLVSIKRSDAQPPTTYYFPYRLAISGAVGEVYLQPNDVVQVLDLRDTTLNSSQSSRFLGQGEVSLGGLIQEPRLSRKLATIGHVHKGTRQTTTDPRGVWTLIRPAVGGLGQDVFVLPKDFVRPGGPAAESTTLGGDVYTYTILPQVPIVMQSLMETALGVRQRAAARQELADERKALEKLHDREDEKMTEHIEQSHGITAQLLRNVQSFKRTLRARR